MLVVAGVAWAKDDPPTPNTDKPQPSLGVQPPPIHIDDHTVLLSPRPSGSLRSFNPSASSSNQQSSSPQRQDQLLAPDDATPHASPSDVSDSRGQGWRSYVPFPLRKASQGSTFKRKPSDAPNTSPPPEDADSSTRTNKSNGLTLSLPAGPFTVNQTQTPGWETPWAPHPPAAYRGGAGPNGSGSARERGGDGSQFYTGGKELGTMGSRRTAGGDDEDSRSRRGGKWVRAKRRLRVYILKNDYVPLVSSPHSFSLSYYRDG